MDHHGPNMWGKRPDCLAHHREQTVKFSLPVVAEDADHKFRRANLFEAFSRRLRDVIQFHH